MKKGLLVIGFCFITAFGYSQNSAVNKATNFQKNGELDKAKELINQATEHEKTKDKGRTWYTKGTIYRSLATSDKAEYQANAVEYLKEAIAAYNKAKELEKQNSTYYQFSEMELESLWGDYLNTGATFYQDGEYGKAYEQFMLSSLVKPSDTTAFLYGAIAAINDDKHDEALACYYKLIDLNYHDKDVYNGIIYLERVHTKNEEKALEVIGKARKHYPNDKNLMKDEINILIALKKVDDARNKLEAAIKEEPDNAILYYNLAFLFERANENEKARQHYAKAIEIDPEYYDANFNLGANYYNAAAELIRVANDMDYKTYQKEGKKYIDRAKAQFKEALPYLEKAERIQPNDITLLSTLQTIYQQLNMANKVKEMEKRITSLEE